MPTHASLLSLYDSIRSSREHKHTLMGLSEGQKAWFISLLAQTYQAKPEEQGRLIFVMAESKPLQNLEQILRSNCELIIPIIELGARQFWGLHRYSNQSDVQAERLRALSHLARVESPCIVLASMAALMQKTAAPDVFRSGLLRLHRGGEYDLDQLLESLEERGFRAVEQVEEAGQFAVKGGLLDLYSPTMTEAIRCEFLADTLLGLRCFSPETQLSSTEITEAWIAPMWEQVLAKKDRLAHAQLLYEALLEQTVSSSDRQGMVDAFAAGYSVVDLPLFLPIFRQGQETCALDYLGSKDRLIFVDPLSSCLERYQNFLARLELDAAEDRNAQRPGLSVDRHFWSLDQSRGKAEESLCRIEFGDLFAPDDDTVHRVPVSLPLSWQLPQGEAPGMAVWMRQLSDLHATTHRVMLLVRQEEHLLRMRSLLQHHGLAYTFSERSAAPSYLDWPRETHLMLSLGSLPTLVYEGREDLLVLPEHVIFGEPYHVARRSTKKSAVAAFRSFQDLQPGSLVVHVDHGIGRYMGMRTMDLGGIRTDFLVLEYADQDKLYLPVHRLNLLQRYAGGIEQEVEPSVDKLKSQGWGKRKARAKKAIREMADQLLRIYAQRQMTKRDPFVEPDDNYFQFEADFSHIETPDQQKAIDEVNADLSSERPMDRLVCGDVGFGKTEVALRAAMRVVLDGYQVLVLAPTTLLSYQHWETFRARFRRFGVEVGLANRFVKGETLRQTIEGFQAGRIDILVGTHRLLSKDVVPRNLGLLVVDEEQRFGVGHKEAIKKLKASCDVLTLTATPIPRSLHMALLGIRDISVIATPPTERLAIKTFIAQFDDELIRKAILQEVQRGGQVFFVHNRVQDILEIKAYLERLMPDVATAIAHGQMKENNVESVIIDFIEQKYQVLLCTTIIESGIDMPNVNTIIINHADKFGLAQLYQMRGRVGRSSRQSYAYFLTHGTLGSREEARQRLEILAAHQELGVGFQIASYDMELRGTGNLLGGEQSGQMSDIGFEMYLDLLEKEMATIRGQDLEPDLDPEIKIPVSAALPASYIAQEKQRLSLYKNLFSATRLEDVERLAREARDRFGAPPEEAQTLFTVASLKVVLRTLRAAQIQQLKPGSFELRFSQLGEQGAHRIADATAKRPKTLHLTADFRLVVHIGAQASLRDLLEALLPLTL